MTPSPRRHARHRGFTLLELIVVIVVLGVLASLALPTFSAIKGRVQDRTAAATLASVLREANSLAALRGATTYEPGDLTTAMSDIAAAGEGVTASGSYTLTLDPLASSSDPTSVSASFTGGGASVKLALRSGSGRCVIATSSPGTVPTTEVIEAPVVCLPLSTAASPTPSPNLRPSSATDGTQGNAASGSNEQPGHSATRRTGITADNRFVVFVSLASNLVAADTNAVRDVFVRDLVLGSTTRVSTSASDAQANGYSDNATISDDGTTVVFESAADNLVAGDTNGVRDVFAKNLSTGAVTLVSASSAGAAANGISEFPAVSRNGAYAVFVSAADNLVASDTNNRPDVFRKDLSTGDVVRASVSTAGVASNGISTSFAAISSDGNVVAFNSSATNLVPGDTNNVNDVFVRNITAGTMVRASVATDSTQGNGQSTVPALDADGSVVSFVSAATNLVADDTNGFHDVFVRDLAAGTTERVSVDADGTQGTNTSGVSTTSELSADGSKVYFASTAANLAGGGGLYSDVLVKDRATATLTRLSLAANGVAGNGNDLFPTLSADGTRLVFSGNSSNIVTGDTNATGDVFVRRLG